MFQLIMLTNESHLHRFTGNKISVGLDVNRYWSKEVVIKATNEDNARVVTYTHTDDAVYIWHQAKQFIDRRVMTHRALRSLISGHMFLVRC